MRITVDTNVLVRAALQDDAKQAQVATRWLKNASLIAVSLPCLCEFVWVLKRVYQFEPAAIAAAIRALLQAKNVAMNRPSVEKGLALLEAGGDFADAVMACEGAWLGGETFVSFDRKAVKLLTGQGQPARLL